MLATYMAYVLEIFVTALEPKISIPLLKGAGYHTCQLI